MKAVLLAAGLGTRLYPVTEKIPKCLIPVNGRPLLGYWLDLLARGGVSEVFINGYYLAERVEAFLDEVRAEYPFTIHFIRETELSGTGGFLKKIRRELESESCFFFAHADNYCDLDLCEFTAFHEKHGSPLTLALFHTEHPERCGIAEAITPDGRILSFLEKSPAALSHLASAAIFLMAGQLLNDLPSQDFIDFSKDVLPRYAGRMYGYRMPGFNIDVGTPDSYAEAQKQQGMKSCSGRNI